MFVKFMLPLMVSLALLSSIDEKHGWNFTFIHLHHSINLGQW